jgi:MinD-like ATPase involved in chromosome partitioning or flagellar assembly
MKNTDLYIYDGWQDVVINQDDQKNIHLIENFISTEDLDAIQNFCKSAERIQSNPLNPIESISSVVNGYETEITKILRKYRNAIYELLQEVYDCTIILETKIMIIQLYK